MNKYHKIKIQLTGDIFLNFNGRYRRDLEKDNWHHYETENKKLYYLRKEHIIYVYDELNNK